MTAPGEIPGLRLRLTYFDQNEAFAEILPRDGAVERTVKEEDGNAWSLFVLDRPIEYEGQTYSTFLLRSRWRGQVIGDGTQTSVFILLVDDVGKARDGFSVDDFHHVAWGEVVELDHTGG
jgi:hypothetical protein